MLSPTAALQAFRELQQVLWPAGCNSGMRAASSGEKAEAWAALDKYVGRYDGAKWKREELYDRAGLR